MKYVSIDLETTGLSPIEHDIVEIGAVIDDWVSPLEGLPRFRFVVVRDSYRMTPYCAYLHLNLWSEIKEVDPEGRDRVWAGVGDAWYGRPVAAMRTMAEWLKKNGVDPKHVIPAGKNFANFDKPFLAELPFSDEVRFKHRTLDPVTYWTKPFDDQPASTIDACARAGVELEGHHTALADCLTVIKLLRAQKKEQGQL